MSQLNLILDELGGRILKKKKGNRNKWIKCFCCVWRTENKNKKKKKRWWLY